MSRLRVTLIDVGSGDSIFLESEDDRGRVRYALIDSNDTMTSRSSYIYLKRHFERKPATRRPANAPRLDWVLLTHAHADHVQGLKRILQAFGTRRFWRPQSTTTSVHYANLIRFANSLPKAVVSQVIDAERRLSKFGDVQMSVLWPKRGNVSTNENDNSVILALTLGHVTVVLTGDAEASGVWSQIATTLPATTRVFKVPHHGAKNGMFHNNTKPWLDTLPAHAGVAISCHTTPHKHPHPDVVSELTGKKISVFRTDQHSHLTFETNGTEVRVLYTHGAPIPAASGVVRTQR
jgi:competence protein ComEC